MAVPGVFVGASLTAIDDKGRLSVSAGLRNAIPGDGKTRDIFISRHPEERCLIASGVDRLERIAQDIDRDEEVALRRGEPFNRSAERRKRYLGGETVTCDASGRFVVSPVLRDMGGMTGDTPLFLFGVGEFFEIWPLDLLFSLDGDAYVEVKEAALAAQRVAERRA